MPRASARRLRLVNLEDRALFDATPLLPLPALGPVAATPAAADDPDAPAGHGAGCACGSCVPLTIGGHQAWAMPPAPKPTGVAPRDPNPPYPLEQTFFLHSRPAATKKIYLDFDGHTTTGTWWEGGATIESAPAHVDGTGLDFTPTDRDLFQRVWQKVMEDFSPFDVDVTTEDPGEDGLVYYGEGDTTWGIRVIITPTDYWSNAGGLAYVPSFKTGMDIGCFVFFSRMWNDAKNITECASHEVGHTLGLGHDGTGTEGYYAGHAGSGGPGWGPLMGVGYYQPLTQWSKGEYPGANNTQDDLAIITNTVDNFGYRPDDVGDTTAAAAPAAVVGIDLSAAGVIERTTDVDVWSFESDAAFVTLTVSPWVSSPNLDVRATLRDAAGTLVDVADPVETLDATLALNLPAAGRYYLTVEGVGAGNLNNGYSDYASLGQYTISGVVASLTRLTGLEPGALNYVENGSPVPLTATLTVGSSTNLNQATVAVGSFVAGQDVLQFTNQGGITGTFDPATGVLTLAGIATPAAYQAALRSVTYANTSETPATTGRTLTFRIRDDGNVTSPAVSRPLTVTAVNDPPVADDDVYSVVEDGSLTVPAATGVLVGDTDPEGAALTAVLVNTVQHGSLTLSATGSFVYTPAPNFSGTDSFTYRARDGAVSSDPATVTLNVTPVNDAPVAQGDAYTIAEDGLLTVAAPGVRGNDTDPDNDPLTVIRISDVAHGALTLNPDGSFTYRPAADYSGPDSFAYKLNDGTVDSNTVTVGLTVTATNDAPVVAGESYETPEDTPLVVAAPGLLANDSDAEGDSFTAVVGTGPAHGSVVVNADGSFAYTPAANYNGPDSFTYTATDGSAASAPGVVNLIVRPVNDVPTAVDDTATVAVRKSVRISVFQNDVDVDGDSFVIRGFTQPTWGSLTRSGNTFLYTAGGSHVGADSFTYTIADPSGATATGTVTLTRTDPVAPKLDGVRAVYGTGGRAVVNLRGMSRAVLPWAGLSRLELAFSENAVAAAEAVTLIGPGGLVPLTPLAAPPGGARTAAWAVPDLDPGTYTLRVDGSAVADVNGNPMAGGYVRSFGILPGDFDGNGVVDNRDLKGIKKKYQSNPAKADRFADVNGDGVVNALDYNLARDALGHRLS